MENKIKAIIAIISTGMVSVLTSIPTFADDEVKCSVLDCDQGIDGLLNLIVDIMTIGVGILGVIGITVVGIQYLTAGGNEEKTRKAKRRLFEIVIGLVAYVLIYAVVRWLGVIPNN